MILKYKVERPLIMGILNVTPDSFSDGGMYNNIENAKKRALEMEKNGADILDIGGESSGPGSKDVKEKEELERVIPIIKELKRTINIPISIDTYKSIVARESLKAGAMMINDVTGLRGDENMVEVAKEFNCPVVIMYSKDNSVRTSKVAKEYENVIETIKSFLVNQKKYALSKGIKEENIIIDPGMGAFISTIEKYSFEILEKLRSLEDLGNKILVGLSRKSFLGGKLSERDELAKPWTKLAYKNGASIIRTHDVKGIRNIF